MCSQLREAPARRVIKPNGSPPPAMGWVGALARGRRGVWRGREAEEVEVAALWNLLQILFSNRLSPPPPLPLPLFKKQ